MPTMLILMISPTSFGRFDMYSLKQQTGDFLIEAMIGTLITALVSLGTLAITSRVLLTQEEMSRQELVVTTLREELYNRDPFAVGAVRCQLAGSDAETQGRIDVRERKQTISASFTEKCSPLLETYAHPITATPYIRYLEGVNRSIKVPVGTGNETAEYVLGAH